MLCRARDLIALMSTGIEHKTTTIGTKGAREDRLPPASLDASSPQYYIRSRTLFQAQIPPGTTRPVDRVFLWLTPVTYQGSA